MRLSLLPLGFLRPAPSPLGWSPRCLFPEGSVTQAKISFIPSSLVLPPPPFLSHSLPFSPFLLPFSSLLPSSLPPIPPFFPFPLLPSSLPPIPPFSLPSFLFPSFLLPFLPLLLSSSLHSLSFFPPPYTPSPSFLTPSLTHSLTHSLTQGVNSSSLSLPFLFLLKRGSTAGAATCESRVAYWSQVGTICTP